jgi:DNA-binding NarL/FixJ family response regulator
VDQPTRVLVADDHQLMREGTAALLAADPRLEVIGLARDGREALALAAKRAPDVVLLDLNMPVLGGLEACAQLRRDHPDTAVLVLSQHVETRHIVELVTAGGGFGYLLKDRVLDVAEFVSALERVAAGETVVDPALVAQLVDRRHEDDPLDELTGREREVLALMAEGLTDRGISERLYVAPKTIETHIRHIFLKLGIPATPAHNRRVHAVLAYLRT